MNAVFEDGVLKPGKPVDLPAQGTLFIRVLRGRSIARERAGRLKLTNVEADFVRAIIDSHDPELADV